MTQQSTGSAIALGTLLFLGLGSLGYLVSEAAISIKSLERTVTVKGLSEREVTADIAIWPISSQVASNSLEELYKLIQNNNTIIVEYLEKYKITQSDITITPPSVVDLYAQNYGNKDHIKFRYTGTSTITIYSKQIDNVRDAMSGVIELGKKGIVLTAQNYNNKTQFVFSGLSSIKPDMIEEATKNARAVANKFASDSDSILGKIKTAKQGQFSINNRDATTPHIKKVRVVSTIEYYLSD